MVFCRTCEWTPVARVCLLFVELWAISPNNSNTFIFCSSFIFVEFELNYCYSLDMSSIFLSILVGTKSVVFWKEKSWTVSYIILITLYEFVEIIVFSKGPNYFKFISQLKITISFLYIQQFDTLFNTYDTFLYFWE